MQSNRLAAAWPVRMGVFYLVLAVAANRTVIGYLLALEGVVTSPESTRVIMALSSNPGPHRSVADQAPAPVPISVAHCAPRLSVCGRRRRGVRHSRHVRAEGSHHNRSPLLRYAEPLSA